MKFSIVTILTTRTAVQTVLSASSHRDKSSSSVPENSVRVKGMAGGTHRFISLSLHSDAGFLADPLFPPYNNLSLKRKSVSVEKCETVGEDKFEFDDFYRDTLKNLRNDYPQYPLIHNNTDSEIILRVDNDYLGQSDKVARCNVEHKVEDEHINALTVGDKEDSQSREERVNDLHAPPAIHFALSDRTENFIELDEAGRGLNVDGIYESEFNLKLEVEPNYRAVQTYKEEDDQDQDEAHEKNRCETKEVLLTADDGTVARAVGIVNADEVGGVGLCNKNEVDGHPAVGHVCVLKDISCGNVDQSTGTAIDSEHQGRQVAQKKKEKEGGDVCWHDTSVRSPFTKIDVVGSGVSEIPSHVNEGRPVCDLFWGNIMGTLDRPALSDIKNSRSSPSSKANAVGDSATVTESGSPSSRVRHNVRSSGPLKGKESNSGEVSNASSDAARRKEFSADNSKLINLRTKLTVVDRDNGRNANNAGESQDETILSLVVGSKLIAGALNQDQLEDGVSTSSPVQDDSTTSTCAATCNVNESKKLTEKSLFGSEADSIISVSSASDDTSLLGFDGIQAVNDSEPSTLLASLQAFPAGPEGDGTKRAVSVEPIDEQRSAVSDMPFEWKPQSDVFEQTNSKMTRNKASQSDVGFVLGGAMHDVDNMKELVDGGGTMSQRQSEQQQLTTSGNKQYEEVKDAKFQCGELECATGTTEVYAEKTPNSKPGATCKPEKREERSESALNKWSQADFKDAPKSTVFVPDEKAGEYDKLAAGEGRHAANTITANEGGEPLAPTNPKHLVDEGTKEAVAKVDKDKVIRSEFLSGLDDLDKFMENVDPPDELDVAHGSSIQEVLVQKGTLIATKRVVGGVRELGRALQMAAKEIRKRFDVLLDSHPSFVAIHETATVTGKRVKQVWHVVHLSFDHVFRFFSDDEEDFDDEIQGFRELILRQQSEIPDSAKSPSGSGAKVVADVGEIQNMLATSRQRFQVRARKKISAQDLATEYAKKQEMETEGNAPHR